MKIKSLRKSLMMSQTEFAQHFNIPLRTLQDWEQERRTPPEYVITMIISLIQQDENLPVQYISGVFALNIPCKSSTCGDWHASALKWDKAKEQNSESIFGKFGIEYNKYIPQLDRCANVANHIRACLDLIAEGRFACVQGMREDFICNERYTPIIMQQVWKLRIQDNWDEINRFMMKEYKSQWLRFMDRKEQVA